LFNSYSGRADSFSNGREYLTGFSKRKKERRARALKEALEAAREERLALRAAHRPASSIVEPAAPSADDVAASNVAQISGAHVVQVTDTFSANAFGASSVTITTTTENAAAPSQPVQRASRPLPKNTRLGASLNQKAADRLKQKLNPDGSRRRSAGKKNAAESRGRGGSGGSGTGKKKH